ncbi:hypothetical protein FHX42_004855 [Saccharopolyspora lacisalsi]|uniref:Chaplin domain-containing protein n=1 Tax=Halosaccharopolyspora lacisalsi TaxID=1000566 RepID=A0A839E3M1_9PSEU|nr:chaplin family protein [Halosaccharopolyspora lacisalsi]MBA8827459.1 hypothetical protein [Halosaccharopolyspora lacisalsi]
MRKKTYLAGTVAATAGLLATATPAFADSADNEGVNVLSGNDISLAPVQLCGNNVAVIGAVVSLASPQANDCTNAPIVDHPEHDGGGKTPEDPRSPGDDSEDPGDDGSEDPKDPGGGSEDPGDPKDPGETDGKAGSGDWPSRSGQLEQVPTAPAPTTVTGHAAVTG